MTNTNTNTYFRYLRLGLSLRPIRGKCDSLADLDYAYALHCDGVQYVLGDYGTFEESNDSSEIVAGVANLNNIANSSRHEIVLEIQNFIEKNTGKRVWSYVGTDAQMSIAFGNEDGYVAQLIMDFESEEKFLEYKEKSFNLYYRWASQKIVCQKFKVLMSLLLSRQMKNMMRCSLH